MNDAYLMLDDRFNFVARKMGRHHISHIAREQAAKALCGQVEAVADVPTAIRSTPNSLVCRRCQRSYWRLYEEAMKDL